jgi:PAS domain S-box-containing protein
LSPIFNKSRNLIGISTIARDITKQKKSELALKESGEKYRELFNNANDQISLIEIKADGFPGNFIEMNEVGLKRLGYTHDELSKMTVVDLVAPDKRSEMRKHAIELQNKGHVTFETVNITKDGEKYQLKLVIIFLKLTGKNLHMPLFVILVTVRKQKRH